MAGGSECPQGSVACPGGVAGVCRLAELRVVSQDDLRQGGDRPGAGLRRIGNIIFDSRRVPVTELAGIYNHAHAFLFPSVGEGFGLCVHPGTLLESRTGMPFKIKDARVGDLVMTKEGSFSPISAVVSRRPGRLFRVRVANVGTVYVTQEHPFLASDGVSGDRGRNLGGGMLLHSRRVIALQLPRRDCTVRFQRRSI